MTASPLSILKAEHDNFQIERNLRSQGWHCVAGTDEVGRGPLAGPVVAACVSLPDNCDPASFLDSKKLSETKRKELARVLQKNGARIGIGIVSHRRIDAINILQASLLAMKLAVFNHASRFEKEVDYLLVDGNFEVPLAIPQLALKKGETKSSSIAAASIIAKTHRDQIMELVHQRFPQYGFNKNKGYPTRSHRQAIARFGPSPLHRLTFKGVREFVTSTS